MNSLHRTKVPLAITKCPGAVFGRCLIDIVRPVPESEDGYKYILAIQRHLSKFLTVAPIRNTEIQTVATALINNFISIFFCPQVIISDLGSNFISKLMQAVANASKLNESQPQAIPQAQIQWNAKIGQVTFH